MDGPEETEKLSPMAHRQKSGQVHRSFQSKPSGGLCWAIGAPLKLPRAESGLVELRTPADERKWQDRPVAQSGTLFWVKTMCPKYTLTGMEGQWNPMNR